MKTYSIKQLKALAKQQGYRMAALEDSQGKRLMSFNQMTADVNEQLDLIPTRLSNDLYQDGIYTVLLAQSINKAKDPDRYPFVKGKLSKEELSEAEKRSIPLSPTIIEKQPSVLTWESAVEMNRTIAEQAARIKQLEFELSVANARIEELEEEEEASLSEGEQNKSPMASFLSETLPSLVPIVERHFALQEKKLQLEELKINKGNKAKPKAKSIVVGSQDHLNYIEALYNSKNPADEDKFNAELDKLEAKDPELYMRVLSALGLTEDNEEEQQEPQGRGEENE